MNRHDRRRAEVQARHHPRFGVFGVPKGAPLLVKDLVPQIMRASLDGVGKGGDRELEERAMACFLVMASHLAGIEDDARRNLILESLTGMAANVVAEIRQEISEIEETAAEQGLSMKEAFESAIESGLGQPIPDGPSEH